MPVRRIDETLIKECMDSDTETSSASPEQQEKSREKEPTAAPLSAAAATTILGTGKVEVSAQTITRMMGIASTTDLKLLEGRIDLLTSKVSSLLMKVDRVLTMFSTVPTPSDISRLEIQLGSLKSMVREALEAVSTSTTKTAEVDTKSAAEEQNRKLMEGVRSSSE